MMATVPHIISSLGLRKFQADGFLLTRVYNWNREIKFIRIHLLFGGPDSVLGIATRYGLGGPGIESRWRRVFPHPSRLALWPKQSSVQWVPRLLPGGKAAGAWR